MVARIGDIVIDSQNPEVAAVFWSEALGYRIVDRDETGVALAGDSAAPTLLFLASTDHKRHKNRIHFDICPTSGSTQASEVARLAALGAVRLDFTDDEEAVEEGAIEGGEPGHSSVVMADPDGNEFCVMSSVLPPEPEPFHSSRDAE